MEFAQPRLYNYLIEISHFNSSGGFRRLKAEGNVVGTVAFFEWRARAGACHGCDEVPGKRGCGGIALIAIERQRSQEDLRRALDEIQ
jgi:hypothetical protein